VEIQINVTMVACVSSVLQSNHIGASAAVIRVDAKAHHGVDRRHGGAGAAFSVTARATNQVDASWWWRG